MRRLLLISMLLVASAIAAPVITDISSLTGGVKLQGTGGTPTGSYVVVSATDLSTAVSNWPSIATNQFSVAGNFNCTNPVPPLDAQRFYSIRELPPATNSINFGPIGFCNNGGTITGGAAGPTVYVGSEEELQSYSDVNEPYTIYITNSFGLSGMDTHVRANKTIIGVGNIVLSGGGLYMHTSSNVIIRNLTITDSTEDDMGLHFSHHIWIDHCTFVDATDGGLDITQDSDYITVSWCKFHYTDNPPDAGHKFACLIAASDSDSGNYRITFHHNWWSTNCVERMPSVRFGDAHIYNNYYNAAGNAYCVRTRIDAGCRVENNFFENVHNPWERYQGAGLLYATNNNVAYLATNDGVSWSASGSSSLIPGTDTGVFTPSYVYPLENSSDAKNTVIQNAGAGKGPFAP